MALGTNKHGNKDMSSRDRGVGSHRNAVATSRKGLIGQHPRQEIDSNENAESLAKRDSVNEFTKTVETSIARCSECVYTAKESLDIIADDINDMALEINNILDTLKSFQIDYARINNQATKRNNEVRENIEYPKRKSEQISASHDKQTKDKHTGGTTSKSHSADVKSIRQSIFPPINNKTNEQRIHTRSPAVEKSLDDQIGGSMISQIKSIARKRSMGKGRVGCIETFDKPTKKDFVNTINTGNAPSVNKVVAYDTKCNFEESKKTDNNANGMRLTTKDGLHHKANHAHTKQQPLPDVGKLKHQSIEDATIAKITARKLKKKETSTERIEDVLGIETRPADKKKSNHLNTKQRR